MSQEEEKTKERILKVARQNFIAKGLKGARMQEIADQAKVNKAMLHYYFQNKDNLYEQVLLNLHQQFATKIMGHQTSIPSVEGLITAIVNTMFAFHKEEPGFVKLLIWEAVGDAKILKKALPGLMKMQHNQGGQVFLVSQIQRLQEQGEMRKDLSAMQIAMNIAGLIIASLLQHLALPQILGLPAEAQDKFLEERQAAVVKTLIDGLIIHR
ncbi:MAG: TetR/AcrR family transcriptional regulator [Oligoflexus sp.]